MTGTAADRFVLVAGVGNLLRSDDGVGVHAVRAMQAEPLPAGTYLFDGGTAAWATADAARHAARVIVIDAVEAGASPGTVHVVEGERLAEIAPHLTLHSPGVVEALVMSGDAGALKRLTVIGVEPASLDCGMDLSAPVQAALPEVVRLARDRAAEWLAAQGASEQGEAR